MHINNLHDTPTTQSEYRSGFMKILLLHDVDAGKQNGVSVSLGILTRELEKSGYDKDFSTGLTMASAIQGLLIPPSHNMVIFCMAAGGVSVGQMFLGGLVPGVVLGITLMIYSYFVSVKHNYPKGERFSGKEAM